MISRIWHAWASHDNANTFETMLKEEIFVSIENRNMTGYHGIQLLRRDHTDEVEFVVIMSFDDFDSVKQFSGEDYEVAVVPEKAEKVLARYDARAAHYEVRKKLGN